MATSSKVAGLAVAVCLAAVVLSVATGGCGSGGDAGDSSGSGTERAAESPRRRVTTGRWHKKGWLEVPLEEERSLTREQLREFARLRSIGYLPGSSPVPMNTGVIIYDGKETWDGLNFYTSGHAPGATLMNMAGDRLHQWEMSFTDAWDEQPGDEFPKSTKGSGYWRRAALLDNGDVVAVFEGLGIIRIDKDSNLLWARFGGFHHDLEVTSGGLIYTLTREPRLIPDMHPELPILEDFVIVLDENGDELYRVSVLQALRDSDYSYLLDGAEESGDILHTNTVELLDGSLAGSLEGFEEGNVLICMREIGAIAIIDLERGRAVWGMGGQWSKPHQPTVLANGNMLIFDNRGHHGRSRVIEFDPVDVSTVWTYAGVEPDDFYSRECGSNQRLPNGNTLISESDRGKAFEVTADGTVVWKFLNPMRAGETLECIATLFEVVRLPPDFPVEWLADSRKGDAH